jgi:DNA-binding response OmpR family regulator
MMDSKTEITRGGEKITVTRKEFKTLEFLTENAHFTTPKGRSPVSVAAHEVVVYRHRAGVVFLLPNFIEKFIPPDCA